jgi:hypothetical protein
MPTPFRRLLPAVFGGFLAAAPVQAQLLGPSFSVGVAKPLRSEADRYGSGLHLGAAFKLPIFPLQVEGALDRMGADAEDDDALTIWSAGVGVPISLTPGLLPVGIYLIPGGGMYRHGDSGVTSTDLGISAGAGVRLGIGFSLFAEGRGVLVLAEDDKLTWLTGAVGIRF